MRKIIYAFFFLLSTHFFGQSPSRINYQGIVRDNAGSPLANKNVNLQFVILQGASPGTAVFTETQSVQTNSMGLFSVQIGSSSNLGSVNFYSGTYSLQVNLDANGSNNFSPMGSPQLLASVPFALHANTVPATFSNNVLTIGTNNSFTLNIPAASIPTIQSSGVAAVSPSTGLNFTVDVPAPALGISGNTLSLTQGTAVSSVTVPVYTSSLTPSGILTSTAAGNNFTLNVPPASIAITSTAGAPAVSSVSPNNFTINIPPVSTTSVVSSGAAATTSLGTNSYSIHVPPTNIAVTTTAGAGAVSTAGTNSFNINIPPVIQYTSGTGISISSGTVINNTAPDVPVVLTGSNGVTIQSAYPNFTIIPPPVSLNGAGIVTVSPGPAFVIGAPSPSFTSVGPSSITGVYPNLTITSPVTPTVTAAGIATVSAGPNYNVGVESPTFTSVGPASITGVYPNLTLTSPVTPTVSAAGIATVSAGPNYVVGVPQPTYAYSQLTGSLTSGTSSEYITPNLSYSAGILTSGPSSNSIAINSGTNALWSTLGNAGTNSTVNFIGTTDNMPLSFRVNNIKSGSIDPTLFNAFYGYSSGTAITTGSNNSGFGHQALSNNITGIQNSGFGYQALFNNTTGSFNTAVGYTVLANNTTGSYNTGVGVGALFSNSTGSFNVAMGQGALAANTTGEGNTGLGSRALSANTTGIYNVALGLDALRFNTVGQENVATGYLSMYSNTNGSFNVAYGSKALYTNTSGGYNAAMGIEALLLNTTGTFNNAFGAGALRANTTAGGNSAFGYEALNLNTTGNDNTAMGMYALRENLVGVANAGFGGASLYNNVSGNYNSTLGHNSLYSQTTGNNNIGFGAYAGYSNVSGSGNVFIGTNAGYFETGSNKFYLANSTTSVTPLLYGDFTSRFIGIGTTNANAPLQFENSIVNRKIVLWEGANNDHQYYGFGINGGTLRYQVNSTGDAHVFYAGTGPAASNEVFRINGTGHFRMGNETGTGQGPTYPFGSSGLVIRRIFTTNTFAGEVVARTDQMTFERDGTNGGFRITNSSGNSNEVCNCTGVTSAGGALNRAINNLPIGSTQVYTDGQNIVFLHCIFGDPYNAGNMTEVSLTRQFPDYFWVGTVTTTQNQ